MIIYANSTVEVEDGFADSPIEHARIVITSVSPKATVSLWVPDYDQNRFRRRDRLTKAKVKDLRDGRIEIVGISEMLVKDVKVPASQAEVTWLVAPGGCKGCN